MIGNPIGSHTSAHAAPSPGASAVPPVALASAQMTWRSKAVRCFTRLARIGVLPLLLAWRASGKPEYQQSKECDYRQLHQRPAILLRRLNRYLLPRLWACLDIGVVSLGRTTEVPDALRCDGRSCRIWRGRWIAIGIDVVRVGVAISVG